MKKRLVAWMMALSLAVFLLPNPVQASSVVASGNCGTTDNPGGEASVTWELDSEGQLTISGTGAMADYQGMSRTVADAYQRGSTPLRSYRDRILNVVVSDGITSIGNGIFCGLKNLSSVSLPDSVTSIGDYAFMNCVVLPSINIPESVTRIGSEAFLYCYALTNVSIPDNVTNIGNSAFEGCRALTSINIPEGVTSIAYCTFEFCTSLPSISIPDSVTYIGSYAFHGCVGLTSVTLPNSVTSIGDSAFASCIGLTSVTIPDSVTSIGNSAFGSCDGLTSVTIGKGVTSSGGAFNGCSNLTNAVIADGATCIAESMFFGTGLTNVIIPNSVTRIEKKAFNGSTSLKSIIIPSSVTFIGADAFNYESSKGVQSTFLSDVYYCGSQEQWNNIEFGESSYGYSDKFETVNIHYANTVIFDTNAINSTITPNSKLVVNGLTYGELPTPSRNGYSFDGWYTASKGGTKITSNSIVSATENHTLYAHWNPNSFTVTFNANGGTVSPTSKVVTNGETYGDLPTATQNNNKFDGWFTTVNGGTQITSSTTVNLTANQTLYAHWTPITTYNVSYDANGGTGTPSPQIKIENIPLTLSSLTPTKTYILQYNANGGSVTPASINVTCTFKNWNTEKNGNGTSYSPGENYTANASVTLFAQWTNPFAGALATPSRSDYDFIGWFTSATGGKQINDSSTISESITLYAHWVESTNPYNLGDETYSFSNYSDSDSPYGHCFGMSITSAGYYNNLLDIRRIGGTNNTPLYSFSRTQTVKQPICYYQNIQGSYSARAIVAGGSTYLTGRTNIASDWQEVLNYVSNHNYDNMGLLQIGFRKNSEGGHAINFLRYEKVSGQDRIYAYDNNFPSQETYFYQDSSGRVFQAPMQTFSGSIDCIALRDCRIYFNSVGDFNATHVLYMPKDAATVLGYSYSYMEGILSDEEYVMYEIPADQDRIIIIPNRDNADFIYMDTEYSFGEITDETRGELRFASLKEGAVSTEAAFRIFEDDSDSPLLSVTPEGTTLHYYISNFDSGNMLLMVADYDEYGKMLRVQQVQPLNSSGDIEVGVTARHKVFLLDRWAYTPLCTAWDSGDGGLT